MTPSISKDRDEEASSGAAASATRFLASYNPDSYEQTVRLAAMRAVLAEGLEKNEVPAKSAYAKATGMRVMPQEELDKIRKQQNRLWVVLPLGAALTVASFALAASEVVKETPALYGLTMTMGVFGAAATLYCLYLGLKNRHTLRRVETLRNDNSQSLRTLQDESFGLVQEQEAMRDTIDAIDEKLRLSPHRPEAEEIEAAKLRAQGMTPS